MAPPTEKEDPLPCPSWIVSNGTNIQYAPPQVLHNSFALRLTGSFSVAKDRSWFADDYTPVKSFVEIQFGGTLPVIGMGTVNLPIKVAADKTGSTSHGTIRLEGVLHVPSILCNIIGAPMFEDYNFSVRSRAFTDPATGRQVAYCKPDTKLCEIQLSGPPIGPEVGPSPFDPSPLVVHVIGAYWPESEQTRIVTEIKRNDMKPTSSGFFGENEDSEVARSMLQNLMSEKRPAHEDDDENDEDEDESDSSMGGDESDPDAQCADHLFTEKQLQWIKAVFGSSINFMLAFELKVYKDEDCKKAPVIAKAFEDTFIKNDSDDSDDDLADSEHSYQEPMLETNYIFSPKQVQWLESKYGSTQNFFLIQKLNPAFGLDCDDARIKAKALMAKAGVADDDSDAFWVDEDDTQNDATDRLFSPSELRYVRCWYINSKNYMAIFRYDATIEADCKIA
ncbi:unnamed protein product [Clonostachys byssicola]|uniref:Uncharacterized protein n=1 Tax=Clonostachys byssicola TaxID=160290 RepID=A0A9N9UP43_9HYPO|nr:unnamed protein product [Clonostachys byssicola]